MGAIDEGAARASATLLSTYGNDDVLLRLPQPAAAGDAGEQLGLATPAFDDAPLGPCVFHRLGDGAVLLIGAATVTALVGSLQMDSADLLFTGAAGIVVNGELHRVSAVHALRAGGSIVGWRVEMQA